MSRDWTRGAVVPILGICLLLYLSGSASAMFDLEEHDENRVLIPITNYGPFGQNIAGSAGTYWPQGTGMSYIFGAGLWVGAIRDSDTLVSVGYNAVDGNFEFYPGPPEHNADHAVDPYSHPEDRIYMSTDPGDTAEWPLRDSTGANIILSEQDSYCLSNDGNQFEGDSIGILMTRHGLVWNSRMAEDMVFFIHTIGNYGLDTVSGMYAGVDADNDVGYADNDLLGIDRDLQLGYTYTLEQEAGWTAPPPYYVGFVLLQSPKASDTVYVGPDTANPDTVIYPGEHLVMTAFKKCVGNIEPGTDPERYLALAGYDYGTLEYNPFDTLDTEPGDKRQLFSAGPFSLAPDQVDTFVVAVLFSNGDTGGLDYLREKAYLARVLWDNNFNPHNVRVVSPNGGEVWSGINDVVWEASSSTGNPLLINIEVSPDSGLSLDTVALGEPDDSLYTWDTSTVPDGFYFLGILAHDSIMWGYDWSDGEFVVNNPGNGFPYVGLISPNGGEQWSGVEQVRWWARDPDVDTLLVNLSYSNDNGLNWVEISTDEPNDGVYDWDTSTFPNGLNSCLVMVVAFDSALADTDVSNLPFTVYNSHSSGGEVQHTVGSCNTITIRPLVIRPGQVTEHLYEVRFGTIYPDSTDPGIAVYTYDVWDLTINNLILNDYPLPVPLDSTPVVRYSPLFDGISLEIEAVIDSTTFSADSIKVTYDPGVPYPENVLSVEGIVPENIWAFHGRTSFEITWEYYHGSPDTLTALFHDLGNDSGVPYDSLWGDSRSFGPRSLQPPLIYQEYMTEDNGIPRTMIYLCGVKCYTNAGYPMDWSLRPEPGEIWTVYQSGDCPPCRGNVYRFRPTGIWESSETSPSLIFHLSQNYPNPFSETSTILYSIVSADSGPRTAVSLKVYDIAGRLVNTLVDRDQESGYYSVTWDGRASGGQGVSNGVYFYRLVVGQNSATKKMLIVR